MIVRVLAILVGLGLLGAAAHVNIYFSGGYQTPHAFLMLAVAAGVGIGALSIGHAWDERRRLNAILICVALVSAEGFSLILTADRLIKQLDEAQAPLLEAADARAKAKARIKAAEIAVAEMGETERLKRALEAKSEATQAVVEKSALRGCASNCRKLLEAQVDTAEREVANARTEIIAMRAKAEAELEEARAALAALPTLRSATPLADRLGWPGWVVDLVTAALGSIAANGLAACLLAFGAHRRRPRVVTVQAADATVAHVAPVKTPGRVDAFAAAALYPKEGGSVRLGEAYRAYRDWCRTSACAPLNPEEFADKFAELLKRIGAPVRYSGGAAEILDVRLSLEEPLALEYKAA